MKKKSFVPIIVVLAVSIWACENDPAGFYEGRQAVYFPAFSVNADSTVFSFLGSAKDVDTVFIDVKLLGYARPETQTMAVRVNPDLTTAVDGVHFESIRPYYEFPPNTYDYQLPIVLKNHPDLDETTVTLAIEIIESEDLEVAFMDHSRARIVFSNIVMKPAIWDQYLAPWFGAYSRIKHIVCMEIMGQAFPQTVQAFNAERNMWRNFGWICNNHFRDHIVMDTDVVPPVRILPWF